MTHTGARVLNIGTVGLGRAFTLMLPTFHGDERVKLVAATDPIAAACRQFEKDFGSTAHDSVDALCADPNVDVVYIASPHQFHATHVAIAAAQGKHVLVEKPMALTLEDCTAMINATRRAGVHLVVGHSHSFNTPVQQTRALIDSGEYGAAKMIHAVNFTDFLYRPRRPEELDTSAGGGVIHSQAAHQIDIVRLLGGGLVNSVRAHTGAWDVSRPTEGAYSTLLGFEGGTFASATYSGYGHFDSDALLGNIGEMGQPKNPADHGAARRRLSNLPGSSGKGDEHVGDAESAMKASRNYGGSQYIAVVPGAAALAHQHFGHLIVSCEKGDLLPGPTGISIYAGGEKRFMPLPPRAVPRQEVIDELYAAIFGGQAPRHSGEWARATTAVCLAMLESAQTGRECTPAWQAAF